MRVTSLGIAVISSEEKVARSKRDNSVSHEREDLVEMHGVFVISYICNCREKPVESGKESPNQVKICHWYQEKAARVSHKIILSQEFIENQDKTICLFFAHEIIRAISCKGSQTLVISNHSSVPSNPISVKRTVFWKQFWSGIDRSNIERVSFTHDSVGYCISSEKTEGGVKDSRSTTVQKIIKILFFIVLNNKIKIKLYFEVK